MALKNWRKDRSGDWVRKKKNLKITKSRVYGKWVIELYNTKLGRTMKQTIVRSDVLADKIVKKFRVNN